MKLLFFDVEATGLDPILHSIVQFSSLYVKDGALSGLNLHCKPTTSIVNVSAEALQKQRITIEQLMQYPEPKEAYLKIRNFLRTETSDQDRILPVGYNVSFDLNMLETWFKYFDPEDSIYRYLSRAYIDVYELIKFANSLGYFKELPNLKLESFFELFGSDVKSAHDASADIIITYRMYQWLSTILQRGLNT